MSTQWTMSTHKLMVSFVFIGEGSSDTGLLTHLERLCVAVGADEARGVIPDFARLNYNRALPNRLRAARKLEPDANLYFIHHDADGPDSTRAYQMISDVVVDSRLDQSHIAVVPIQETEAWLLLDEPAIRRVASKPNGRAALNLPPPHRIEATASPKERLRDALLAAAELQGRRRDMFRREFDEHRRILLDRLPVGGELERLEGWRRLRHDTAAAIADLRAAQEAQA